MSLTLKAEIMSHLSPDSQTRATQVRANIQQMNGYAPGEQPRVGKIIKLNTNENPYPPSEKVVQAIQQAATGALQRYPDPMATPFRLAAAQRWGVEPDWVLAGNGSDDLLTILTRTFVGEGQTLRLPYPSYILYRTLADIQGARFEEIPFRQDWTLGEEFIAPAADLRLVFLPNPNSPSGTVISKDQIRSWAEQLDCPLFVDEAYADFANSSCVDLTRECPNVIVTRTMSKSYALAGIRFGYLIAQPAIIQQLAKVKDSYNCDTLSIAAATAALMDEAWLAQNIQTIQSDRQRLTAGLQELGFIVQPSEANFVWCTHPKHHHQTLYQQLKDQGILVRYMDYPNWGNGLRMTVGNTDQINALLAVLSQLGVQA